MTWQIVVPLEDDEPEVGRYEQTFHIGQRVRVRLNGECQTQPARGSWCDQHEANIHWRLPNGSLGNVDSTGGRNSRGHSIHVRLDPVDIGDRTRIERFMYFAACELEPLGP